MKNKKIFIDSISSFLIIGGFLSPSYSVFAMKRSPKMQGSPNKRKMTSKKLTKDQKLTEFDYKMEPSKKTNKINSKQEFFFDLAELNHRYLEPFKDKNFGELVISKDGLQHLKKAFHITERIDVFYNDQDSFFHSFYDNVNTVIQDYNVLVNFLKSLLAHSKHILLFPSNCEQDNDDRIPVPQEISIGLFKCNLMSVIQSLIQNCVLDQLIKTKLLFFIYATGLYFFFQINTKEKVQSTELTILLSIPIVIDRIKEHFKEILEGDTIFAPDLIAIQPYLEYAVVLNRLDTNEQMLFKNISQHLKAGYTNFLAQYDLKNIDIPSPQFSEKLEQLLSSEKSQDLLRQFLCDITYPLISLLRHFKDNGFVFFAGKDTNEKYVCIVLKDIPNQTKDLQLFEKRATFLTEALSSNCVKDDKLLTNTIVAMEDILRFIPVTFSIIESEEQCKNIDLTQNFSFYQFSENAGISTDYKQLTQGIKGCLDETINDKINKVLETITEEELKDLGLKTNSLMQGGYINLDDHLSRSLDNLRWITNTLNKDASYYFFAFPNIIEFDKHLNDVLKSFYKLKEDVDIIESLVESLKQIVHWQNQYQGFPPNRQKFFKDIKSNILSINKNLEECLNQLENENFHINEEWINNIIDQQEKLDETIQDFEAKKKLMNQVSKWLNQLRNLVGILENTKTNISRDISRTKKATKTKTNHKLSVPISSSSDLDNMKGKLDDIITRINTLESNFFNCCLNTEELKQEVSSLKGELNDIAQGLSNAKVKKLYMQDQSLDQSLNAQNEVVKYEQNQILFINGHVKNEAESFINQNGIYKEDMNKFIQSLGDGSINSHPFHTNTLYFQKFSKEDQNTINKCINDFKIQYVCYKNQNGQNSSLRILFGIDKKKENVIIFYVGAPFHKGSKASTLSTKNFTGFDVKPL